MEHSSLSDGGYMCCNDDVDVTCDLGYTRSTSNFKISCPDCGHWQWDNSCNGISFDNSHTHHSVLIIYSLIYSSNSHRSSRYDYTQSYTLSAIRCNDVTVPKSNVTNVENIVYGSAVYGRCNNGYSIGGGSNLFNISDLLLRK